MKNKLRVIITYVMAAVLGLGSTAVASTSGTNTLESTFKVGNVTQNIDYTDTVNAKTDDVVRYEIWYHNNENETSGKNINNLNIKVTLPTDKSTTHTATAVVGGTNSNTVTNSATVKTAIATTVEYIPGTAYRRYNAGTNAAPNWVTEKISDSVMTSAGYTITSMKPCWNFQETITVQARVKASVVSINKQVKIEGTDGWKASVDAKPGDTVAYLITVKNEGNTELKNVMVRDEIPPRMDYIEGSAVLTNSNFPNGYKLSDLLIQGGVNTGNYAPGGVSYVRFTAKVPATVDKCMDNYEFNNVGIVKPEGMGEYYNTAKVVVDYPCPAKTIACVITASPTTIEKGGSSTLTYSSTNATSGTIDGIGSVGTSGTKKVSPTKDTTYKYTVTGEAGTATCNTTVKVTTKEVITDGKGNELPTSGPVEAAAGAVGLTTAGGAGYVWLRSKKALLSAITKIK